MAKPWPGLASIQAGDTAAERPARLANFPWPLNFGGPARRRDPLSLPELGCDLPGSGSIGMRHKGAQIRAPGQRQLRGVRLEQQARDQAREQPLPLEKNQTRKKQDQSDRPPQAVSAGPRRDAPPS